MASMHHVVLMMDMYTCSDVRVVHAAVVPREQEANLDLPRDPDCCSLGAPRRACQARRV